MLLREVLTSTKMKPNAAHLGGALPITIRFSRLVGDIMRRFQRIANPLSQYVFYVVQEEFEEAFEEACGRCSRANASCVTGTSAGQSAGGKPACHGPVISRAPRS